MNDLPQPSAIMAFLDKAAIELDELGKQLEQAHLALGNDEAVFDIAIDAVLVEMLERAHKSGERLPGEDVRTALARKRVGEQVYKDYKLSKARVEAIKSRVRAVESATNARQSTLKGLQMELSLEGTRT